MCNIKQRYIEDAATKDMVIVSHVKATRFLFKRNSCGHIFEADISAIRHNKNTLCKECTSERLLKAEKDLGLTFIEKIDNIRNRYVIEKCGHSIALYKANIVRNEGVICQECEMHKLLTNLEKHGLELVEYRTSDDVNVSNRNKVAKVRFKECGHTVNRFRSFKHDYGSCEICAENNRNLIYNKNGLSLIATINSAKSIFKFNNCGHERIMYNSAAIRGNCLCQECNESSFNKKSKIYIIKIVTNTGEEFLKFGYGKDIPNRVREYRFKNVNEYFVLFERDFNSGADAMLVEKSVHKALKGKTLPIDYSRKYLTRGGFTECYPMDMFDEIMQELCNKEKEVAIGR